MRSLADRIAFCRALRERMPTYNIYSGASRFPFIRIDRGHFIRGQRISQFGSSSWSRPVPGEGFIGWEIPSRRLEAWTYVNRRLNVSQLGPAEMLGESCEAPATSGSGWFRTALVEVERFTLAFLPGIDLHEPSVFLRDGEELVYRIATDESDIPLYMGSEAKKDLEASIARVAQRRSK